ncbi:MAG TPA: lactate racemase domain-containing protein [Candidatus Kapabacteria bacterium]|nr:lactate racemase domain-containing protein [Candidatus Kapabacteria bacterium]
MRYYYTYYPTVREVEIPDANLIGVYGPLEAPHTDREQILRDAFASPVNSPQISELATAEDRVLIVLDDALEPTPTVFPFYYIVQELHAAGVPDSHIKVLLANAMHRASSSVEVDRKIGAEMHRKYAVYQSALNEREDSFHTFGTAHTPAGPIAVTADKWLRDASLIIGIGGSYPNRFKGFTGGGSLIFPGLANEDLIGEVYLAGASAPSSEVLGRRENPGRSLIWELLPFVPAFKFCVDLVVDRTLNITACVTGAPASVYRVSADVAARMFNFPIPEPADIVMIDSHPLDMNIFQAAHALYAALGILKQDGEIIVVSPLLESISPLSATLAKHLSDSRDAILRSSRKGELSRHPAMGAQLAAIREVVERASRITFVTHGPGMADPPKFGFEQSDHAQAALDAALSRKGSNARVALITHGAMAVPRV